jgi:hypothetical protein
MLIDPAQFAGNTRNGTPAFDSAKPEVGLTAA